MPRTYMDKFAVAHLKANRDGLPVSEDKFICVPNDAPPFHRKSKEEKRLVLKQDLVILPLLSFSIITIAL